MAETPEKLHSRETWFKALQKVGVSKDACMQAATLILNEEIAQLERTKKTFKP
jgi:hypothetical protein